MSRATATLPKHEHAPLGQIHPTPNWSFADLAERNAKVNFAIEDVGCDCQVGNDDDGWVFFKIAQVISGVASWVSIGGGSVAKTKYFGLRIYGTDDDINFTVNKLSFFTKDGFSIPVSVSVDLNGNTVSGVLQDELDKILDTDENSVFTTVEAPPVWPIVIYFEAPGFYAEDVAYFELFANYSEYGRIRHFEYVVSNNASIWMLLKVFRDQPSIFYFYTKRYWVSAPKDATYATQTVHWGEIYESGPFWSNYDAIESPAADFPSITSGFFIGDTIYTPNDTGTTLRYQRVAHIDGGAANNIYHRALTGTTVGAWSLI